MAEATHTLPQIPTTAQVRITTAAHVLAQFRARQAVKQQLQRRGVKVSHLAAREITALAIEYLAAQRSELMPEAIAAIERMMLAGEFGERAQRAALSGSFVSCDELTTTMRFTRTRLSAIVHLLRIAWTRR
jgi:hypothetical protein